MHYLILLQICIDRDMVVWCRAITQAVVVTVV